MTDDTQVVQPSDRTTLGWREWVSLPDLGLSKIKAKVDTGARTSALHAYFVEPYEDGEILRVRFGVHPIQGDEETSIICDAPVFEERQVTDSGGHTESRFFIQTSLLIGATQHNIEMSLTNRDTMKFRMLLGRTSLKGQFSVDPELSFCSGEPKL